MQHSGFTADARTWQALQDCFAELIGTSIRVVDAEGRILTNLSRPQPYCTQVIGATIAGACGCKDCFVFSPAPLPPACQDTQTAQHPQPLYFDVCPFLVNRVIIPLYNAAGRISAHVHIGPVIVGQRRAYPEYVALSKEISLHITSLVEGVEKVRIVSLETLSCVAKFVQEAARFFLPGRVPEPSVVVKKKEVLPQPRRRRDLPLPIQTMLQALFETAREGVAAERGSLMLFDKTGTTLKINTSRGIPDEVVSRTRLKLGEGLAGWVAQEQITLFVSRQFTNPRLLPRLSQPQLNASVIMPIQGKGVCLGVLSLSTTQKNHSFSPENIKSIERLAKMFDLTVGSLQQE